MYQGMGWQIRAVTVWIMLSQFSVFNDLRNRCKLGIFIIRSYLITYLATFVGIVGGVCDYTNITSFISFKKPEIFI